MLGGSELPAAELGVTPLLENGLGAGFPTLA